MIFHLISFYKKLFLGLDWVIYQRAAFRCQNFGMGDNWDLWNRGPRQPTLCSVWFVWLG